MQNTIIIKAFVIVCVVKTIIAIYVITKVADETANAFTTTFLKNSLILKPVSPESIFERANNMAACIKICTKYALSTGSPNL